MNMQVSNVYNFNGVQRCLKTIAKTEKIRWLTFLCLSNVRKLKTICQKTVSEIHAALYAVCETDIVRIVVRYKNGVSKKEIFRSQSRRLRAKTSAANFFLVTKTLMLPSRNR